MFWALYLASLFAGWAMMVREGLWSNTISLINIIICGLVAFGFYSPLAIMIDEQFDGQFTYLVDFICLWALFVVSMVICKTLTKMASRTRMRFKNPIDPVGGPLMGLLAAWVLSAFIMATLHTSPMPKDTFGGRLVHSQSDVKTKSALTSPDLGWLRFVERVSGPNSFGASPKNAFKAWPFVYIYGDHREKSESAPGLKVRRG